MSNTERCAIGIDIGGTKIAAGLVSPDGKVIQQQRIPTQAHLGGDYKTSFARSQDLAKICNIFQYGAIWGGFEAALQLLGICEKSVFKPYQKASAEDKEKVREILVDCGLLNNAKGQAE